MTEDAQIKDDDRSERGVQSDPDVSATQAPPASIPRRHDLDALRAIAMLLGIALHGVLSFMPIPEEAGWPVRDRYQSESYSIFLSAIHGFRMPLFFLVSGFFTAMLWRKRGLGALIAHRFKRIFLPLLIGALTIVPLVFLASWWAIATAPPFDGSADEIDVWRIVSESEPDSIPLDVSEASINKWNDAYGTTPLTLAVTRGDIESVQALLERGADVDARNRDGSTPLHAAALFGRAEIARSLLESGADPTQHDRMGFGVKRALESDLGRFYLLSSLSKIEADATKMIAGRHQIAEMLPEIESADIPRHDELGSVIFMMLTLFPIFYHLWFLSFLCWLVAGFAVYALMADRFRLRLPNWVVVSPLRYLWLIPLTFLPQLAMGDLFPTFGPDTSVGLIPVPEILGYYAIFFFFGALYFDSDDTKEELGRRWWLTLPIAICIFPFGYEMTMGGLGFSAAWIETAWFRPVTVLLQVLYVWLMSFGLMGLFRRFFSAESKTMRYVSDSSYWLYLAHLPLIMVAQAVVRDWPIPAFPKFVLVCVVTSVVLLLSYEYMVRYSFIGTLLNGKRTRSEKPTEQRPAEPAAARS